MSFFLRLGLTGTLLLIALSVPVRAQPTAALALSEAEQLALQQNPRLLAAGKDIEAARARIGVASAPFYPTANFISSASNQSQRGGGGTAGAVLGNLAGVGGGGGGGQGLTQISLSVQQIILDFGRRGEGLKASQKDLEATEQQFEALRQDLLLEVRQRYFQTYADQETVRVQEGVVANQETHLKESQGFFKAGLQARNEMAKAEADLAQARLDLVLAQNVVEQDWVALNQSMGVSSTRSYQLTLQPIPVQTPVPEAEATVEVALKHRPEARQILAQIEAARARMEQVYRNRYPTLSANAQTGYRGVNGPLDDFWSVGINLNFNLFNGFLDRFQADTFRAQAESLGQLLEATRQQVYRDTTTALINLRNAWAAIEAAQVNVRASSDNFELARKRYETGLGSNLEYQDAQLLLARAQIGELQAVNRYRTAHAALLRAVGLDNDDELRVQLEKR